MAARLAPETPPPWFKAPSPPDEPTIRKCRMCGAPPGERCRYTTIDPATGRQVDNVVGQPMQRSHKGR